jgi:hypothetical protein
MPADYNGQAPGRADSRPSSQAADMDCDHLLALLHSHAGAIQPGAAVAAQGTSPERTNPRLVRDGLSETDDLTITGRPPFAVTEWRRRAAQRRT